MKSADMFAKSLEDRLVCSFLYVTRRSDVLPITRAARNERKYAADRAQTKALTNSLVYTELANPGERASEGDIGMMQGVSPG